MRRWQQKGSRRTERWQREDDAPRLKDSVPSLKALKFELDELIDDRTIPGMKRVRHIMVDQAAALFEIPCSDTNCEEGGHQVTDQVLRALQAAQVEFVGSHACRGMAGDSPCKRVLTFKGIAEFGDA